MTAPIISTVIEGIWITGKVNATCYAYLTQEERDAVNYAASSRLWGSTHAPRQGKRHPVPALPVARKRTFWKSLVRLVW